MGFGQRWKFKAKKGSPDKITVGELGQLEEEKEAKYKSNIVERNGIKFPSKAEADRWDQLCFAQQEGTVTDLKRQVKFDLEVNGQLITTYRADFTYYRNGVFIVEDKKGAVTPEFKLKFKLMKACLGIEIYCTDHRNRSKDPLAPKKAKKKKLKPGEEPKGNMRMSPKTKQTTLKF